MKKILALIIVAGMITFIACGPSAKDKAEIQKKILDSIKKADSLKVALKLDSITKDAKIKDSLAKVEKTLMNEKCNKISSISTVKTQTNTNNVKCNSTYKFTGVLKDISQPGTSGCVFTVLTDENKTHLMCDGGIKQTVIIKQASAYLAGDAILNTKLINKRYVFCCETNQEQGEGYYVIVNMKPL